MLIRRLLAAGAGSGSFVEVDQMRELAYAENSSGPLTVTSTNFASPNTLVTAPSVAFNGSTTVIIESGVTSIIPGGAWINAALYEDGSIIGILGGAQSDGSIGGSTMHVPWYVTRRHTPAAGSHVYSIGFVVSSGTGQVNFGTGGAGVNDMPAYIRIVTAAN